MLPLLGHRCFTTQEMSMFSMIPIPAIGSSKQHLLTSRKPPYVWQAAATSGMAPAAVAKVGAWEIMPKYVIKEVETKNTPDLFRRQTHWCLIRRFIDLQIYHRRYGGHSGDGFTPIQSHLHRQPKAHGPGLAPAQSKASSLNNSSYVSHFASVTGEDDNIVTVSLVKRVNTMTELSYHCETRYRGWCFLDTLWLWPYESIDTNLPNVPWSCCKQSINWINATKWREEKEMNMMLVNARTTNIQRSSDILDTDTNDHKCNNACQIHSNTTFIDMVHSQNL